MIKYSVIVPVYNSEKTIARCLDSLTSQQRDDIQIIVVNDGSTDSSDTIIREFADHHPQILYISQANAGVSQARNTGIEQAVGSYVLFVDSDDFVKSDYFSALDTAEACDLLVFAHECIGGEPLDEEQLFVTLQNQTSSESRLALLLASRKIMSPCNKRFKLSTIRSNNLHFLSDMHIGEDFNFCMAYAVCCESIVVIPLSILCVDISNQASLSRKYRPNLDQQLAVVFEQVANTIHTSSLDKLFSEQLLAIADYLFIKHVFSCLAEEFKQRKLSYIKDRKQIARICNSFRAPLSNKRINLIHRVLRIALAWKIYYPFFLVSYWVKGRKYQH